MRYVIFPPNFPLVARINKSNGFSLLEVMASVVVLAVGMLGMASVLISGLRMSQDGYLKSIATNHAYVIMDAMRSNPVALSAGNYNYGLVLPTSLGCSTTCTAATLAQNDAYNWSQSLATNLPSGTGAISLAGGVYTIQVRWDRRTVAGGTPVCGTDPTVNLSCVSMVLQP